jgi:hypothetical protein
LQLAALQNSRFDQGAQALPPSFARISYGAAEFAVFLLAKFTPAICFSSKRKQSTARFRHLLL